MLIYWQGMNAKFSFKRVNKIQSVTYLPDLDDDPGGSRPLSVFAADKCELRSDGEKAGPNTVTFC